MIRKVLRFVAFGFCLLSMLACAGAGWAWWAAGRGEVVVVQGSLMGGYLLARAGEDEGWYVCGVGHWPGRAELRADRAAAAGDVKVPAVGSYQAQSWDRLGLSGWLGRESFYLADDGTPARAGEASAERFALVGRAPRSAPLPYVEVNAVPYWLPPAATALPPLLWLAFPGRGAWVRRRRRRLGLCRRCGYDLRGGAGRCPECGTEANPRRVSRRGSEDKRSRRKFKSGHHPTPPCM